LAFARYADDYHLFCDSKQEAYLALRTISETLGKEGLVLQRSKTRILTKAEFSAQVASVLGSDEAQPTPARRLMALSLRYDPYSANAMENYLQLREELSKIDIVGLLNEQLARSQIHIATTKKIVAALRHIDPEYQLGAVVSLLDNMTSLHPIASLVLIAVRDIAVGCR
jgi:hypothetical protein